MVKEKKWFVVSRKEKVAEDIWKSPDLTELRGERGREKKRQRGWQAYQGRKHGPRRKEAKRVYSQND